MDLTRPFASRAKSQKLSILGSEGKAAVSAAMCFSGGLTRYSQSSSTDLWK